MCARSGLGGSLGGWGAGRAHKATANETHRADDDAAQAVGDCQADQADGGDLPVEEPLEEVGGDQGAVSSSASLRMTRSPGVVMEEELSGLCFGFILSLPPTVRKACKPVWASF